MNAVHDLDLIPAATPPPGVQSNFNNPPNFDSAAILTVVLCVATTTIAVAIRMVTKVFVIRKFAVEDYLVLLAWGLFVAYNGIVLKNGLEGYDRHQWDVTAAAAIRVAKRGNIGEILYGPTIWLAKASLLFQLINIFASHHSGVWYWSIHALIWTNFGFYLGLPISIYLECTPREKIWLPQTPGHCINIEAYFVATGVYNIVSEVSILMLPIWAIWHLQMPVRRKIGVSTVFATGTFAFIASIIRLVYTFRLFQRNDQTYLVGQVGLWSLAEIATVILCCCFPVLPRFFKWVGDDPKSTQAESSAKSSNSRGFKSKVTSSFTQPYPEGGSDVEVNSKLNGPYVELEDRRSDYAGRGESPAMNLTHVSASAGPEKSYQNQHGIRKTITVETLTR